MVLSRGSEIFSQVLALQLLRMDPNLPMPDLLQHDKGAEGPLSPGSSVAPPGIGVSWGWYVGAHCVICLQGYKPSPGCHSFSELRGLSSPTDPLRG